MTGTLKKEVTNHDIVLEISDDSENAPRVDNKNFASMNGVHIETDDHEIPSALGLEKEVPEPEQIITTRTVTQQPWIKTLVIGGGVFLFVGILGGLANVATDALRSNGSTKIQPDQNPTVKATENPKLEESGETKTALALTTQKGELADLNKRSPKEMPEVATSKTPTTVQKTPPAQPQVQPRAVTPAQPQVQPRVQPRAVTQTQPQVQPRVQPSPITAPKGYQVVVVHPNQTSM